MNYKTLTFIIKRFGSYQNNSRGISKYVTNITFNGKFIPKDNYNKYWQNEIEYFIGQTDKLENEKWWKKDPLLLNQYKKLFSNYNEIVKKIKAGSRNCTLTNSKTCITSISFYVYRGKISLWIIQRSADVSLGLKYDYNQMFYLLKITAEKCNFKIGKLHYKIINAHIYINNINKKNNFILN